MIDERKESIYPIITRYGILGKCSVSPTCHSSDCSWFRQLNTDTVGGRNCLHPYSSVEYCVRSLSANDFLTILSMNESLSCILISFYNINHINFFSEKKSSAAVASLPQWKLRHCKKSYTKWWGSSSGAAEPRLLYRLNMMPILDPI